jgi:hypothetical protein
VRFGTNAQPEQDKPPTSSSRKKEENVSILVLVMILCAYTFPREEEKMEKYMFFVVLAVVGIRNNSLSPSLKLFFFYSLPVQHVTAATSHSTGPVCSWNCDLTVALYCDCGLGLAVPFVRRSAFRRLLTHHGLSSRLSWSLKSTFLANSFTASTPFLSDAEKI